MAGEFGYVSSLVGLFALIFWWDSLELLRVRRAELAQAAGMRTLRGLLLGIMVAGAAAMVVAVILALVAGDAILLRISQGLLVVALWLVVVLLVSTLVLFFRMRWTPLPGPFVGIVGVLPFAIFYLSFHDFDVAMQNIPWVFPLLAALATLVISYLILWRAERLLREAPATS